MPEKNLLIFFICVFITSCASIPSPVFPPADPYLWLEEIETPRSLDFSKAENEKTFSILKNDPNFNEMESILRKLSYAKDRVPWTYMEKGKFYNFWRDEKSVRGIWRRTTLNEYKKSNPKWEPLIDLDELAKQEDDNWVWEGADCLPPQFEKCLISLSRGGKDATVVREFNLSKKTFVKDGFYIPEAKTSASWIDENSLYVGTDNGPGSLTDSGYARTILYLKRGEKLANAPVIFEINKTHQSAGAFVDHKPEKNYHFLNHNISFYQSETFYFENGVKTLIQMPSDSTFYGLFRGYLLYILKSDLITESKSFKSGSLVALPFKEMHDKKLPNLELIFEPTEKKFLQSLAMTKDHLLLETIENIQGKIINVTFIKPHSWKLQNINLGKNGVASVSSSGDDTNDFIATYTDFITPYSAYIGDASRPVKPLERIKSSPARFDANSFVTEQKFAKSKDGTMIPYFIIRSKKFEYNGSNPTLLYGYGGFEISLQPTYLSSIGLLWLEKGGVYVQANIRGGAEFGPAWHQAAVKEKHQVVFDDFIAIAEDLIQSKVTTPRHLGIQGGSNGGLLVAGTFVQRPELFNAVICEVPLLDMFRYHTLLAGASWMDEYGNPDDPKMREVIGKYSPYQNVKAGVTYPEVFFFTSTKDDRVHPGHARKMVAKMREQGHPLYYYENIEGGHDGVANLEQGILKGALEFTYLWKKLK